METGAASIQNSAANSEQPSMDMMQQIQTLKNNWEKDPKSFEHNVNLGNAYFDISRFDKAVIYYRNAISQKSDNPNILIDLAVSYFNLDKADSALFFIEDALQQQPDHIFGLYNAGIIYYNLQRVNEAISTWQRLISKHAGTREAKAAQEFIRQIKTEQIKS